MNNYPVFSTAIKCEVNGRFQKQLKNLAPIFPALRKIKKVSRDMRHAKNKGMVITFNTCSLFYLFIWFVEKKTPYKLFLYFLTLKMMMM